MDDLLEEFLESLASPKKMQEFLKNVKQKKDYWMQTILQVMRTMDLSTDFGKIGEEFYGLITETSKKTKKTREQWNKEMAANKKMVFDSLIKAGFSPEQALQILLTIISSHAQILQNAVRSSSASRTKK